MKKYALYAMAFLALGLFVYACGGGGGGGEVGSGTVAVYITDDISDYKSVTAIINSVSLLHTGSGATCTVLENEEVDIAELSDVLELVNLETCPERDYNRIRLTFDKSVGLINSGDVSATCEFTDYKSTGNSNPNKLYCEGNKCFLDINGAVNVFAGGREDMALDFDLKEFEVVGFPNPGCTVTMKVSPLHSTGFGGKKFALTGFVSGLTNSTFILTKANDSYLVDYSGAIYNGDIQTNQGIRDALDLAVHDHLRARVIASSIDLDAPAPHPVTASAVFVIAKGTVSSLDGTAHTFDLTYDDPDDGTVTIAVDYYDAYDKGKVEGILDDGKYVDVRLFGYDGIDMMYLASKVEVE